MKGKTKIGSTLKGIGRGPTWIKPDVTDCVLATFERHDFKDALQALLNKHAELLSFYNHPTVSKDDLEMWARKYFNTSRNGHWWIVNMK